VIRTVARRVGLVACVISCAALLFLWGRSTQALDCVFYSTYRYDEAAGVESSTLAGVFSKLGSVGVWHYAQREPTPTWRPRLPDAWTWSSGSTTSWPTPNRFGFRFGRIDDVDVAGRPGLTFTSHGVMLPYWLLIPLFAVPPARALLRLRRTTARARRGECLACGYDLRAAAPHDRCPECGATRQPHRDEPPL
jgi:hypothetical protein